MSNFDEFNADDRITYFSQLVDAGKFMFCVELNELANVSISTYGGAAITAEFAVQVL